MKSPCTPGHPKPKCFLLRLVLGDSLVKRDRKQERLDETFTWWTWPKRQMSVYDLDMRTSSGSSYLGDHTLEGKLLLLEVVAAGVLDLELGHGVAEGALDLLLLATLELHAHAGVADDLLNAGDVALELLPGLELLAESLVGGLELLGVLNHLLDLVGRELANGVGDGDVGAAARGLLSGGNLEDTVDVNLEDGLEDSVTGLHGRNRSKGELAERGVVGAVHTFA